MKADLHHLSGFEPGAVILLEPAYSIRNNRLIVRHLTGTLTDSLKRIQTS